MTRLEPGTGTGPEPGGPAPVTSVRVVLPGHLRTLAHLNGEVRLEIKGPCTADAILDALEARHEVLTGAIRDRATRRRRPFVRYYACGEDLSHDPTDRELPAAVASGVEPFIVLGAMSGG